jgi:hypothetical protein
MTTFAVPSAGPLAWRQIYPTPPNARIFTVGPYCPLDETVLQERPDGFVCPVCRAAWDFRGLASRWLDEPAVRWRPSTVVVLAVLASCAAAAVALVAVLGDLDQRLLVWLSAAIAAAAVVYVAAGWLSGRIADWPYRRNRVTAVYDSAEQAEAYTRLEQALGGSEVSDEH